MFDPLWVLALLGGYIAFLFALARWAERRKEAGRPVTESPWVYALALTTYCTCWTFYGSVGKAVGSGAVFLAIYVGPTLSAALWWTVLRKLVRLKTSFHITSIADLLASRYGKSHRIAALATIMAFFGSVPYVALQLKSVISTFALVARESEPWLAGAVGPLVALIMILSTILLGARRIDPTDRHPGMVASTALLGIIKLVALVSVGLFAIFGLHHGWTDLLSKLPAEHLASITSLAGSPPAAGASPYVVWASYLILAMSAILFLPHQFHLAVVENADEAHIPTATWLFPLYLLVINAFVVPIAAAGLAAGLDAAAGDTYVLALPALYRQSGLAMLVFLGGFSAAMGMIMVSSMTNAVMLTNNVLLPVVQRLPGLDFLKRRLLHCRWAAIAFLILASYGFGLIVGDAYILVNIGIIAFGAAIQFAPAILGGIFWRGGTKAGALAGLGAGFILWLHTMFLPALAKNGYFWVGPTRDGLFGLPFLRAEALFGLTGLDPVTHSLFWTMACNAGLYVLVSLLTAQSREEAGVLPEFTGLPAAGEAGEASAPQARIDLPGKLRLIEDALAEYMPMAQARELVAASLRSMRLSPGSSIFVTKLARLYTEVEKAFSGVVGAAAAHQALERAKVFTPAETRALGEAYSIMLAAMHVTPDEMARRIDYYIERERLLARHAEELRETLRLREHEIEERRRAESALRTAEEKYRGIFMNAPDGIFQTTMDGRFLSANPAMARMLGYAEPEELITTVADIGRQFYADPGQRAKVVATLTAEGYLEGFETELRRRDASPIWVLLNVRAVCDRHKHVQFIEGVCTDITERKRVERELAALNDSLEGLVAERTTALARKAGELEEANRQLRQLDELKSAFLSSVSHELRTPLTSILGFAKLIKRDFNRLFLPLAAGAQGLDAKGRRIGDNLDIIEREGERLTRLINDFLDLTKIESGRLEWRDAEHSLSELMLRGVEAVRGQFAQKPELALVVDVPADLPRLVVDADRFEQVVINVLTNAWKFTDRGSVTVSARVDEAAGQARLRVADTGIGVPASDLERIFDKFHQVRRGDTLDGKPKGTGLGLSICRQIVEHYGGRIWAESEIGKGSAFVIELPLPSVAGGPGAEAGAPLILVVDDDAGVREYLSQIFRDEGYAVAAVPDGASAVAAARLRRPDLITMDQVMPGLTGEETIQRLREDPVLRAIPILAISVVQAGGVKGADASLRKPVDPEQTVEAVRCLLSKKCPDGTIISLRRDEPAPLSHYFALCEDEVEHCDEDELWRRLEEGFRGTVVVPAWVLETLDLSRLTRAEGVSILLVPERPARQA